MSNENAKTKQNSKTKPSRKDFKWSPKRYISGFPNQQNRDQSKYLDF